MIFCWSLVPLIFTHAQQEPCYLWRVNVIFWKRFHWALNFSTALKVYIKIWTFHYQFDNQQPLGWLTEKVIVLLTSLVVFKLVCDCIKFFWYYQFSIKLCYPAKYINLIKYYSCSLVSTYPKSATLKNKQNSWKTNTIQSIKSTSQHSINQFIQAKSTK